MVKGIKAGFTMVELLIVLVILAILAAVAAPIYLANVKRSMASDAVAIMSVIRQAERETKLKGATGSYVDVDNALYSLRDKLGIQPEVTQFFAHPAFRVVTTSPAFTGTMPSGAPAAQDFLIKANGARTGGTATLGQNVDCALDGVTSNCAVKGGNSDVANMLLEMDNSGRIRVSYDAGTTWEDY